MIGQGTDYPMPIEAGSPMALQRPTLRDRLVEEKTRLSARLSKIESVLTMLDESPEVANIFDAVSELGGF